MEYIEGVPLDDLLTRRGPLPAATALGIVEQIARALDAVHAAGLIHRDVKPGNVIVTDPDANGVAYLTDFGVARAPAHDSRALTAAGEFVGTCHYTAPEQILGNELDGRADVYSLGCVLYECLAGEPPFPRLDVTEVLLAHIEAPPPVLTERRGDLAPALDSVIERALTKNPRDRFASCSELIEAARPVLAAEAGSGAPGSSDPEPGEAAPGKERPAPLRLKVTAGNAQGKVILVDDELLFGRHAPGEGKLEGDPEISRRHALIARTEHGFSIEDLGSTNGTVVNGRVIDRPAMLSVGDELQVGNTALIVQVSDTSPHAAPPTAEAPPQAQEPEPAAEPPTAPRVALRVEVDLEAGEAHVELAEDSDIVRLVFEDGRWRIKPG
jgi:hypothetical protein